MPADLLGDDATVADFATSHPLATRVLGHHGIDFCCGGGQRLAEASRRAGLTQTELADELFHLTDRDRSPAPLWATLELDALVDRIEEWFHRPLDTELPRVSALASKVARVHGERLPQLVALRDVVLALCAELTTHMHKEEQILFPAVRAGARSQLGPPVHCMEHEHDDAGRALQTIRALTLEFRLPEDACRSHRELWAALEALERALHEHIHVENNILFPKLLSGSAAPDPSARRSAH